MDAADRYDSLIKFNAERFHLNFDLLKAQVKFESNFDPRAVSTAGAMGLAQLMPRTFEACARALEIENPDLFNPEHNLACQAWEMSWLHKKFDDIRQVLAAYNWGYGNLSTILNDPNWFGRLPVETQRYVEWICNALGL